MKTLILPLGLAILLGEDNNSLLAESANVSLGVDPGGRFINAAFCGKMVQLSEPSVNHLIDTNCTIYLYIDSEQGETDYWGNIVLSRDELLSLKGVMGYITAQSVAVI